MTSDTSLRPISPLRARMIEDMTVRGFNELSVEEVRLLLRAATAPKYKAAFATAYGAGLRVSEVVALKVSDIDSERMLLRVERGKGRKDRHAMLRRLSDAGPRLGCTRQRQAGIRNPSR